MPSPRLGRFIGLPPFLFLPFLFLAIPVASQQQPEEPDFPSADEFLIPAGAQSGLPRVAANDNRVAAGVDRAGVRVVSLEVVRAEWRIETEAGPGLRVAAVAEEGRSPTIPAPLIRVTEGTTVRVRVRNGLEGSSITVFGLHERPDPEDGGFELAPGEARTVEFKAGAPGTYLYRVREGPAQEAVQGRIQEREQLAGALVVDPEGGTPTDRIMVINIFGQRVDDAEREQGTSYLEALTINGRSWPYTERMAAKVGATEHWRVVNASRREHPMHLHGFYFTVLSRGDAAADTVYAERDQRLVVTESMLPGTTMAMEWTPTRPGRWLFHCHLSFHVTNRIRLPGAVEVDPEHAHSHMAGLVMGIEVAPGPSDLVATETVAMDLYANEYGDAPGYRYGFARTPEFAADSLSDVPGPVLVFHQYQAADVTVHNTMSVPTGVHWHGLELDGWADGVPGWSASDGRVSPVIEPGEEFTYRLSFLRPGTFIYHSHLDDIVQLTGGLYGALIVLPEGGEIDPRTDHVRVWGWNNPEANGLEDMDLNGRRDATDGTASVGESHRFRIINIAPAGMISAWITREDEPIPYRLHAKDGADLPEHQQVEVPSLQPIGVGETVDFIWTPDRPGVYELRIGYSPQASIPQRWVVTDAASGEGR
ncbi:MAG: multicopper oxidase domain-containing protein [Gemmatimonadales bacterium]|nr:MAG: multicopper oxidase domain-containing protein [Gemmatimonadales bacterium]